MARILGYRHAAPLPGPKPHEGGGFTARCGRSVAAVAAAAAAFALCFCDGAQESRDERREHAARAEPETEGGLERMSRCYGLALDDGLPDAFSHGHVPAERRREEMEGQAEMLGRRVHRGRSGQALAAYLGFFEAARFSTGERMYPNVAGALRESAVFESDDERLLAARRVVNAMKSTRISHANELLLFMPHTAVSMMNTTEIEEVEGMSSFLLLMVGHARRLQDAEGETRMGGVPMERLCRMIEGGELTRITKEQLDALDRFYAPKVSGFIEYDTDCRKVHGGTWIACNTKSNSSKNLCEDITRRTKAGELERFGVRGFGGACFPEFREDQCGSPYAMFTRHAEYCGAAQKRRQERWAEGHRD